MCIFVLINGQMYISDTMNRYYLYLDECGDQNLSSFDPQFPIFTLCGIIVSEEQDVMLSEKINMLKEEIWENTNIILHSRDIRKCQNGFEVLFDLDVKKKFLQLTNEILGTDIYVIVCCSIMKEAYIRQYGKTNDVYGLSLSYIMERTVFYLESLGIDSIELNTIIERRGKKEDASLLNYYNQVLDRGTYWVDGNRMKRFFKRFDMRWKAENIVGLQVADLIAYPITRHILNPSGVNLAYDVIKKNIFTLEGKVYGMKIFPKG